MPDRHWNSKFLLNNQEAKNTAALKAQIDKLQQERDEFQKMVIGNQVGLPLLLSFERSPFLFSFVVEKGNDFQ